MYDRQSESLWSQLMMEAVAGPLLGDKLKMLATSNTTWAEWKRQHRDTWVLTKNTDYRRDYTKSPYPSYEQSAQLYFEVENKDEQFHTKVTVIGIFDFSEHSFNDINSFNLMELLNLGVN